jgi:uncharacterized protein (UPF0335 family)
MANIEEHFELIKGINEALVSRELFDFIRSIESDFVDLNRKQLNENSKDIYGQAIGFYSKATEVITKGAKKAGEPFDAKDTGSFLNKMYAKIEQDRVVFGSTDSKVELIMNSDNWLSHDLFGLTDDDLNKVINEKVLPFMIDNYRKHLGL